MGSLRAVAVLALAGSAGALPHDHRHRHVGHDVLDPLLERRPDEVVGAKRTNLYAGGCKSDLPHTYKGPKLGSKEQVL